MKLRSAKKAVVILKKAPFFSLAKKHIVFGVLNHIFALLKHILIRIKQSLPRMRRNSYLTFRSVFLIQFWKSIDKFFQQKLENQMTFNN